MRWFCFVFLSFSRINRTTRIALIFKLIEIYNCKVSIHVIASIKVKIVRYRPHSEKMFRKFNDSVDFIVVSLAFIVTPIAKLLTVLLPYSFY